MATVLPYASFAPKDDALALRKAMKGFGCDSAAVLNIICARNSAQRQELLAVYKQVHGRDLMKDLKKELSGKLESLILALMTPSVEFLAEEVKRAIKGIGTNESVLIEIICTRKNAEIDAIKGAYMRLYGRSMEEDVAADLSGDLKRLMVALMTARRPEHTGVNIAEAKNEAKQVKAAGVDRWGTDESVFITALCANSFEQTKAMFREYRELAGHDIIDAIEKEMSGDLKTAFVTVVKSILNTPLYFAERLEQAMRGSRSDDRAVIRILVSRSEIDLAEIANEYQKVYGCTLVKSIEKDTSGDYKRALLLLLTGSSSLYK